MKQLQQRLSLSEQCVLHLDHYYKPEEDANGNWDSPSAIDYEKLYNDLSSLITKSEHELILVEGFLLFASRPLVALFNLCLFIRVDEDLCKQRRMQRDSWLQQNPEYFTSTVWPSYIQYHQFLLQELNGRDPLSVEESITIPLQNVPNYSFSSSSSSSSSGDLYKNTSPSQTFHILDGGASLELLTEKCLSLFSSR